MITKTKKKALRINWKARALKAEPIMAAAVELDYRDWLNYQTYTNREAAVLANSRRDKAFEDLRYVIKETGMMKRT